jgi:Fe-S-cluster containining protein
LLVSHTGNANSSVSNPPGVIGRLPEAKRLGLLRSLAEIYAELPETECERCGRCCYESPGVFFIEQLALLDVIMEMPRTRREHLLDRALRELFFSWIEEDGACIFLQGSRCTIYERRPLACRLFGIAPPADPSAAEREARLASRQEAKRLGLLGIDVPEATVLRSRVGCDEVRARDGAGLDIDADAMADRVAQLDMRLLPEEVVLAEYCFSSLPERLGAAAIGQEAVELMRVQMLRRAQRGESIASLLAAAERELQFRKVLG